MYPDIPSEDISWPITQHAGVVEKKVIDGLLHACLLCRGEKVNAEKINGYIVDQGILTKNVRSDSNRIDAWRDYQQILSEFGLIYSTSFAKVLTLTSVAMAYLNHALTYKELMTFQVLRYQYPNGHKSNLSASLVASCGDNLSIESYTEWQTVHNVLLHPAVLVWLVLHTLWNKGQQAMLTIDEMQQYVVRCTRTDEYEQCADAIVQSRRGEIDYLPLRRARRNMSDWLKILDQTLLFKLNRDKTVIAMSSYSIQEENSVLYVCKQLLEQSSYWKFQKDDATFKQNWFKFYGDYDNNIEYVLKE